MKELNMLKNSTNKDIQEFYNDLKRNYKYSYNTTSQYEEVMFNVEDCAKVIFYIYPENVVKTELKIKEFHFTTENKMTLKI